MANYTIKKTKQQKAQARYSEVERNEKMCDLYRTGYYSYNKLAKIWHITPQRVSKIITTNMSSEELAKLKSLLHGTPNLSIRKESK